MVLSRGFDRVVVLATNPPPSKDPLDTPLFYFDQDPKTKQDIDPWTMRNAFEGTQIFGATGSGKTSGSGRTLALSFLTAKYQGQHPFGGIVLCAKPEEVALWANFTDSSRDDGYCKLAKREPANVMVIGVNYANYCELGLTIPDGGYCFDFLGYMASLGSDGTATHLSTSAFKPPQFTNTLVSVFMTALEAGGDKGVSSAEPYWEDALRQMLTNAVDLILLAEEPFSIENLNNVIISAPQSRAEVRSEAWQKGACWRFLDDAQKKIQEHVNDAKATPEERRYWEARKRDLELTIQYWLLDFAGLAERTRSIIVSSFTSKATGMTRYPMRELFSSGRRACTPTDSHKGKVIILDLSVKEFGETGRFAQVLFKTIWQRATEHPSRDEFPNPVFLWADESQYFVTSEDTLFQQTARSKRVATVYMTQNISNYYAVMAGRNGNAMTDSLLGNFNTKIFHANGDPASNEWAERLFGKTIKPLWGYSGANSGQNESIQPAVPVDNFSKLAKGGDGNPLSNSSGPPNRSDGSL